MPAIIDSQGRTHQIEVTADIYAEAKQANLTIPALLNRKYGKDADAKLGTAAEQIFASEGLISIAHNNPLQLRPASVADILDGKSSLAGSPTNVKSQGTPFGSASRILFPAAVIAGVEASIAKERDQDTMVFDKLVATTINIGSENFEQPVVNYQSLGGPEQAKAQRVAQLANPPAMLSITTSDRQRRIASHAIGLEMSDQALRATTLDLVVMTMTRFLQVERDDRVYRYINDLWNGNSDLIVGAVTPVASSTLDAASTGGVLTHKAWLKFLARNRKYRKITHVIGDIDTYLKVEGRTGRPGSNNYDPTLSRIDPQATAMNVGFGNDVQWFIVDAAVDGGPVPANTVYALDASQSVAKVVNTAAAYQATEDYVLRRASAMRMDWSEDVYRLWGDSELRSFDALTIS